MQTIKNQIETALLGFMFLMVGVSMYKVFAIIGTTQEVVYQLVK